jgi:hypothetical protein
MLKTPQEQGFRWWAAMNYRNIDLKVDQFVTYLNEDKINLIPPSSAVTYGTCRLEES